MVVVMVVIVIVPDSMAAVAAGAHVLQALEATVRQRLVVQLEVQVFVVAIRDMFV